MKFDREAFEESWRHVRRLFDAMAQREYRAAIGARCTEITDTVVPEYRSHGDREKVL